MLLHVLVAFGLSFALGTERELRSSGAGDRVFSLIGVGSAVIGVLAVHGAPNALAGAITGVGFIGGGLTFRQSIGRDQVVRGITTAAAIFACAAIGAAAGEGYLLAATVATGLAILTLEIRYLPGLGLLDARRWAHHFANDEAPAQPNPNDTSS